MNKGRIIGECLQSALSRQLIHISHTSTYQTCLEGLRALNGPSAARVRLSDPAGGRYVQM